MFPFSLDRERSSCPRKRLLLQRHLHPHRARHLFTANLSGLWDHHFLHQSMHRKARCRQYLRQRHLSPRRLFLPPFQAKLFVVPSFYFAKCYQIIFYQRNRMLLSCAVNLAFLCPRQFAFLIHSCLPLLVQHPTPIRQQFLRRLFRRQPRSSPLSNRVILPFTSSRIY